MKVIEIKMEYEKETKNTIRYKEVGGEEIKTLYIAKTVFKDEPTSSEVKYPANIAVKIEEA